MSPLDHPGAPPPPHDPPAQAAPHDPGPQARPNDPPAQAAPKDPRLPIADQDQRLTTALAPAVRALRGLGRVDDAAACVALIRERPDLPRIVVVGEANRGKSTLVNALLERPHASPVGTMETTATFVRFVPLQPEEQPWAKVQLPDGTEQTVPLERVRSLADLDALAGSLPPLGIEVHLPAGPLGQVVLTDTPGVGGIAGARGQVNRRLAGQAGLLIFVLDAGSALSRAELDYLQECAETVESVLVVVSMTDKYPQTAGTIVDHVRAQLARTGTRLARVPVFGVSAANAELAADVPVQYRAALLASSGIPQLRAQILRRCQRAHLFPGLNALRAARESLHQAAAELATTAAANSDQGGTAELLAERHAALLALQNVQQRWGMDLDREFAQLRTDLSRLIGDRLEAIGEKLGERIEKVPLTRRGDFVRQLSVEVASEYELLRQEATEQLHQRVVRLVSARFDDQGIPSEVLPFLPEAEAARQAPDLHRKGGEGLEVFDIVMAAPGAAGIAMRIGTLDSIGGLTLALPALHLAWPLAVLVGGGWLAFTLAYRTKQVDRRRLTAELGKTAAKEKALLMEHIDGQLRELKPELVVTYRAHLGKLVAATQRQLREAEQAKTAGEAERKAATQQANAARSELLRLVRELDDVIANTLRSTGVSEGGSVPVGGSQPAAAEPADPTG